VIVTVGLIVVSVVVVVVTGTRPSYDPYGWLVWGHQTLHWNLNTDGAPSFKPLPYLFTVPYALAGRAELWLWMVTSVAISLSGAVFAGQIAYRLTGASEKRYAPVAAAAFAALGLLGIRDYWHYILSAESDPMVVSLCLGAIAFHLSGRTRVAFVFLLLAALGRPEVWPFVGVYAVWAWRAIPSSRGLLAAGVAAIPVAWFVIPAFTAKSWLIGSQLAMNSPRAVHGSKIDGVIDRVLHLYELPMQLAALVAIVLAVSRRDRAPLLLAGAALAWVAVEIGFALHGWSAVPRYLFEPAAVTVVLAGSAVGQVLAATPRVSGTLRWVGPAAVVVLVAALLPAARLRARVEHTDLIKQRGFARQIDRLRAVIDADGGAAGVLACGQPVTEVGFQSTLAWEVGLNVGNVGYKPGRDISRGKPIVLFKPRLLGWQVRPIHTRPADRANCSRLTRDTELR
jgi:hypothetical protein